MLERFFLLSTISLILAGCGSFPRTVMISPKMTLPQEDISLMGITINITSADRRCNQALTKISRDKKTASIASSRDLRLLLQEVLEKQMIARGYMIDKTGAVNLQIVLNDLYAHISQRSMKYTITTIADISIFAFARNENKITKNYRARYSVTGVLQPSKKRINNAINNIITSAIANMAYDTYIHNFIKQNARF